MIVQYQQRQFTAGDYAPYELQIPRPTRRITDEYAPVHLLEPDHPVLRTPNVIRDADWADWVQERGLYCADPWDERFQPLIEMTDPEGNDLQGSLLVTRYGQGTYVYVALSFFRTIPAGVTGTYRLFMNLLSWDGAELIVDGVRLSQNPALQNAPGDNEPALEAASVVIEPDVEATVVAASGHGSRRWLMRYHDREIRLVKTFWISQGFVGMC